MDELALSLIFTGAVIFVWGFRAIRNRRVNVAFFKLRSQWSTLIFGINSVLCGFLMIMSGVSSAMLDAGQVEIMAKSGLYMFGAAWIFAFALEALARIGWRISPADAPRDMRKRENVSHRNRRKRKPQTREDSIGAGAGFISSSRRRLQTAKNRFLLAGSRLYHRVMLPPRSWDKQNLWHGDEAPEKQTGDRSPASSGVEFEEPRQETRPTKGKRNMLSVADSEKESQSNGDLHT